MTTILVIAGSDSSGGAGITRDTSVAAQLGVTVKPVVTAVTVQTDHAVRHIHPVPPSIVAAQIGAAFAENPPEAVKIGMLATSDTARAVATALRARDCQVVLDPVLTSSSGSALSDKADMGKLIALATIITPNLEEAAALTESSPATSDVDIAAQASALHQEGAGAVLIKGGHGTGEVCVDHLFDATGHHRFSANRQPKSRRGTGCFLAAAIACHLAKGRSLQDACAQAHLLTQKWIADA